MDYAIIISVISLGAGVSACLVRRWFFACGEQQSEFEAVVQKPGAGTKFFGGSSREGAIREASEAVDRCRRNGVNRSALHVQRVGRK